jgi:hypothetical protein
MIFGRKKEESPAEAPAKKTKVVKKEEDNYEWDKKRIFFGLLILLAIVLIGAEVKGKFFPNVSVLGDAVERKSEPVEKPKIKSPNINLQSQVNSKLSEIKKNIGGLNPEEVASTSPQIQKVLKDIEGLKDLPANEAKDACMKICSGI